MIELRGLTKRYGDTVAVQDLTVDVHPGRVTGFLGPNGAGKSTTMRMILGLDRPTAGEARVGGRSFATLREPLRHVGALLEADALHPGRSARSHLRVAARSQGITTRRVDEVLEQVGLASVARRRVRSYSLGMRQRLGIAGALLGDPAVVLFDEPVNGLDADGVRWVRHLVRDLADEGRTVFVSSHLMSEVQQSADHLIVIGRGRLIADAPTDQVLAGSGGGRVRVRSSDDATLVAALARIHADVEQDADAWIVSGASAAEVGEIARTVDVALSELAEVSTSLEQAYLELTTDSLQYVAASHHSKDVS